MGVFEKATAGNLNDVVYVYCNSSSFWFTYAYAIYEITIRNANELVQYICCPSIVLNFRQICPDFHQLNMIDVI